LFNAVGNVTRDRHERDADQQHQRQQASGAGE